MKNAKVLTETETKRLLAVVAEKPDPARTKDDQVLANNNGLFGKL